MISDPKCLIPPPNARCAPSDVLSSRTWLLAAWAVVLDSTKTVADNASVSITRVQDDSSLTGSAEAMRCKTYPPKPTKEFAEALLAPLTSWEILRTMASDRFHLSKDCDNDLYNSTTMDTDLVRKAAVMVLALLTCGNLKSILCQQDMVHTENFKSPDESVDWGK
jgi:hypothetical protein